MNLVLNVLSLTFSIIAIAVSAGLAYRQVRHMHHANLLPVVLELFGEFRAAEFKPHMIFVEEDLRSHADPETTGTSDMSDLVKSHTRPVQNYFNTIGILFANGVIDITLVSSYMGRSVIRAWDRLAPYVYNERNRRGDVNYLAFFENLAAAIIKNGGPDALRRELHLHTLPPK